MAAVAADRSPKRRKLADFFSDVVPSLLRRCPKRRKLTDFFSDVAEDRYRRYRALATSLEIDIDDIDLWQRRREERVANTRLPHGMVDVLATNSSFDDEDRRRHG